MFHHLPSHQVCRAIEAVADELLDEAGVIEPPVDAMHVAKQLSMLIVRNSTAVNRAHLVRVSASPWSRVAIVLAEEPRPERRQWAVAHELGEHAAARVFAALGVEPVDAGDSTREQIANRLAGCLLLPGQWLACDGAACGWDLLGLKQIYSTASHELIARRMLDMQPPVVMTLFDHGRPTWRRSNFSRPVPRLAAGELAVWRSAYAHGRPSCCDPLALPDGVEDIRAWPVHEPEWKREIVRTSIAEVN